MLAKQIGIVVCRVAAVVLVVQTVRSFGFFLPLTFQNSDLGLLDLLQVLSTLVPGFVAVFLWVFAERISTVPGSDNVDPPAAAMSQIDLISVGTLVIGIYVFAMAIFSTVQSELNAHFLRGLVDEYSSEESSAVFRRELARLSATRITNVVELVLGAALVAGRASIARVVTKARYAGTGAP